MNKQGNKAKRGPENMKHTLGRLMGYLGKHKLGLVLVIIFIIINSVAMVGSVAFLSPIINNYILPGDFSGLARELTLLGSIFLLGSVSSYVYARVMVHIAQKSIHEIRSDLFNKMQKLSIKYFDSHTHGDLMSLYTNDIESISEALNNSVTNVIASSLSFIGVIVMMIVINPILTLITLSILGVMILLMKKIGKQSGRYFGMQQMRMANLNGYIEEMIEGQKVVKVFCHEEKAIEQFEKLNEELREASTGAQTFAGSMMPLMGNVSHINFAINCCLGAVFTIAGILNLGTLIAYLQYVRQVSQPVTQVSQQMNVIIAALAGAERIFKVLDEEPEVDNGTVTLAKVTVKEDGRLEEADHYTGHWAWNKNGELVELKGDVKFDNVVFGYNEEKTILKGISLFAKPGQKIAFVGSTGAGKTTITNLINRFYEINSGTITYDGINIKEMKKDELRKSIGIVLQDTHLFTGTIADNIRYGNLHATDEEVVAAAKLANAHSFIKHLPHGYDTILTGDGEGLSQGQRQLLAIARAAVANPPVLIMDEATSSIDTRTEKLIAEGMDKLMEGRTVFVIAHRLSTVRNSDAIMVLEQGEIIERGSHDELLEQKGRYYQLYTGKAELE